MTAKDFIANIIKKSKCKICGGKDLCLHNKEKYDCVECNGIGICIHGSRKRTCAICEGSQICIHKKHKNICVECEGIQICIHKKNKYLCKDCDGKGICKHKINKKVCSICEPTSHLISLQRRRINSILKNNNLPKKSTIDLLGCDVYFFKNHIEKQLSNEMRINGYEIDHIKPVSKFNFSFEGELEKCCHWSNLRPMLKIENRRKSNKWTEDNENDWKILITRVSANLIV